MAPQIHHLETSNAYTLYFGHNDGSQCQLFTPSHDSMKLCALRFPCCLESTTAFFISQLSSANPSVTKAAAALCLSLTSLSPIYSLTCPWQSGTKHIFGLASDLDHLGCLQPHLLPSTFFSSPTFLDTLTCNLWYVEDFTLPYLSTFLDLRLQPPTFFRLYSSPTLLLFHNPRHLNLLHLSTSLHSSSSFIIYLLEVYTLHQFLHQVSSNFLRPSISWSFTCLPPLNLKFCLPILKSLTVIILSPSLI